MKVYVTNYSKNMFWEEKNELQDGFNCMIGLRVYPDVTYQTVKGFGGAFTEASGYNLSLLSKEKKTEVMEAYFGNEGIGYSLCRTHINSCDFALGNYAYVEDPADTEFQSFHIGRDREYIIPMIKEAQALREGDITLLASPWSPPAFMKTNGEMNHGGKLKKEYYEAWAKYMARYVKEYEKEGIRISMLSVQNEPEAVQTWDSCIYTAEEEMIFVRDHLGPVLEKEGLNVKILIWDHNKDILVDRARGTLKDNEAAKYIHGIAFHWYTGDHFEAIQIVRDQFPEKELYFTEGCVEFSRFMDSNEVTKAEMYAHDMIGNFNGGMNGFIDWNMLLDEKGGPNHVHNYCAAPIMCDTTKDEVTKRLSYYYIGHFSKFVKPGAKRIAVTRYTDAIETVGFANPNGERVVVILNKSNRDIPVSMKEYELEKTFMVDAHSMMTVCIDEL